MSGQLLRLSHRLLNTPLLIHAVAVTVHVALGQDPASVKANALAALQAYVDERHRIGVTVAASGLWRAAHVPNAERVEAIAPVADIFVKPDGLLNAVDAVRISQSARDTIFLNSKAHSPVRFGDGKSFAGLRLGEWLER